MRMFQFVDSIDPSPAIRLDLNSMSTGLLVADWNLDPPPLRRSSTTTMLADGATISAAAYDDRVLHLELQILTPGTAAAAAVLQSLARELNRPENFLRVRLDQDDPRTFRTKRAPDYTISNVLHFQLDSGLLAVDIPAEPFALGLLETIDVPDVSADPATTNGCTIDIPSGTVLGDVETPPIITIGPWTTAAYPSPSRAIIATRRRGTPSSLTSWFAQGESITSSYENATTTNTSPAFSGGAAVNAHFAAGNESMTPRFNVLLPNGPESPGTYRIFAALQRQSPNGLSIRMQWRARIIADSTTYSAYSTPVATLPADNRPAGSPGFSYYNLVDLGLISLPVGQPLTDNYSGVARAITTAPEVRLGVAMSSDVTTTTGAYVDYIAFVPADESLCMIGGGDAGYDDSQIILDGPNDDVLIVDSTGALVHTVEPLQRAGSLPMLSPAVAQRIYVLREAWAGPPAFDPAFSQTIGMSYYPRYLYVS